MASPQDTQLKLQFIEINGRQVPFVLPQVWDEDLKEWVVTSNAEPLPVADSDLKQELTNIKQTQAQILERLNGTIDTQLTGSLMENGEGIPVQGATKIEIETIVNAQSVDAGTSLGIIRADYKGESLTIYAINVDKQPFNFYTTSPFRTSGYGAFGYPSLVNVAKEYSNTAQPATILQTAISELDSYANALAMAVSYENQGFIYANRAEETATATIKVMRVWR